MANISKRDKHIILSIQNIRTYSNRCNQIVSLIKHKSLVTQISLTKMSEKLLVLLFVNTHTLRFIIYNISFKYRIWK